MSTTQAAPAAPTAPEAPKPGTPEYDAAMAAKVDDRTAAAAKEGEVTTPPATPAEPQLILGKFKDQAALEAAYKELEGKLGQPKAPEATPPKDKLAIPADQQKAQDAVTKAGLDMNALAQEFAENGDLKPETFTKLAEAGIPKPMVDAYISGQKALAAQYDAAAFETAGSQEQYGKLVEWAKTSLSHEEKVAFNAAVSSGDKATMQLAVSGLRSRFEQNFGKQPETQLGGKSTPAGDVYESMAQVTADMRKPEYKKDPAFRAKVMAKLDRSSLGAVVERN